VFIWVHRRLLLLPLVFAAVAHAADPSVEVTANRPRLYLGESVLLTVKVSGSDIAEPDLSALKPAQVRLLGSSDESHFSLTMVNGQWRREGFSGRRYTFELTPAAAGDFRCGPVRVRVDGREVIVPGPVVRVQGVETQGIVAIALSASREAVLVDEPFDVRLTVHVRRLQGRFADADPILPDQPPWLSVPYLGGEGLQGLDGPDVKALLNGLLLRRAGEPGFQLNDYKVAADPFDMSRFMAMRDPFEQRPARFRLARQFVTREGRDSAQYELVLRYTPREEGDYTFGPVVFKGTVPTEVADDGRAQGTEIFAVGPAVTVRVVPPPEANRPDSYVGAVGSNLVADAAVDSPTCNVGDPLSLTLTIRGDVQLRNLFPPRLGLQTNLLARFEVYDETVKSLKPEGARQYVYTLRPRQAGSYEIPPLEVAYYDVNERGYRVVTTRPIPIKARPVNEVTAAQILGARTNGAAGPAAPRTDPLAPSGLRLDPAGTEPASLWRHPLTGPVAAAGPLTFVFALLARYSRPGLRRLRDRARRHRALARAAARLVAARRQLPAAPDAARRMLCAAMRSYLTERFDVPTAGLTPPETEGALRRLQVPEATARQFSQILERNFNAAFARGADAHGIEEDVVRARQTLATIHREGRAPAAGDPP
jgi:hypothetical protein